MNLEYKKCSNLDENFTGGPPYIQKVSVQKLCILVEKFAHSIIFYFRLHSHRTFLQNQKNQCSALNRL